MINRQTGKRIQVVKRAFCVAGVAVWNNLPIHVRTSETLRGGAASKDSLVCCILH